MATLTLKNVPAELVERLREEAQRNRRSLNQETLRRLEVSLAVRRRSGEEMVSALRGLHERLTPAAALNDELLARARAHGRP